MKHLFIMLLLATAATAQEPTKWDKLYKVSVVSVIAANGADVATSYGRRELNPLMGNTFGMTSVGIKAGMTGGILTTQHFGLRHSKHKKIYALMNFGTTGVLGFVAYHNTRVH